MDAFDRNLWQQPAEKFKALGHPLRLWIALQLMEDSHCVQELVDLTDFDFSTVSQHLTVLKTAGVLEDEKRGKQVFYRLKCRCVRKFLESVIENRKQRRCQQDD